MIKALWGLPVWIALAGGTAAAQPKPPKAPTPAPAAAPAAPASQTGEKAGADESLQQGGENRPWAAGISPERQKVAHGLFREGNDLLNQGLFARAGETYRKALESWPHPAIHYNLALAQMNLDQPIEAYENFQKAIAYGEAPLEKDKVEHAKDYMLLLDKQIANVEVTCEKPGARVSVDGKEVFVAPGHYKARVRIGRHTFFADKKGYTTRVNAPFIGPGENFRIELKLYTAEELTRYTRRWNPIFPYSVIGAGLAVGLAGVVLELSAQASYKDYDRTVTSCSMNNQGCPTASAITDLKDAGDRKKLAGVVGYGVAGAAISAGVVLMILNRPSPYHLRPEDLQEEEERRHVSITPIVSPTMAGATVQGHF